MREKVRAFMEQYHMVTAGERVLLGLSGGADSVCLFHLLRELQEPLGFSLLAVHVNHNLRGAEAGRDAAFAENLCREYDVPFYLYSCPVEKIAKEKHLSTEEAGRAARQEVFAACAKEQRAVKIALAHHQDDVAASPGTGNVAGRTCLLTPRAGECDPSASLRRTKRDPAGTGKP